MAMIGIRVPDEITKELAKISVPGTKTKKDEYHITMFYFEKTPSIKDTLKIIEAIYNTIRRMDPIKVEGSKVTTFPKGPDGVPVIITIGSEELLKIRKKLAKKLDDEELKYSKLHPEFHPHLTLSYSKKETEDKKIDKIKWTVTELVLWCGNEMDDGIIVSIPFVENKKSSAYDEALFYSKVFEKLSSAL